MALTLEQKKEVVAAVVDDAQRAISAVVADYRGLTVSEMTQLRKNARKVGVSLRVVKNSLTKRAFLGTQFECLNDVLSGPLCVALATEAPGDAARLLRDFAKDNDKLIIRALAVGGICYDPSHLESVANLPTRIEALTKLVVVIQAPIQKFVRTLAEPHAKLVRTIAAVADKKKAG